uniref:hypothetical protein n=1 Tax=Listeria monocytogenes TaxID=1639 RepID=UPI003132F932
CCCKGRDGDAPETAYRSIRSVDRGRRAGTTNAAEYGQMSGVMTNPGNRNSRVAWTVEEIRFVEQNYGSLSAAEIGKQ